MFGVLFKGVDKICLTKQPGKRELQRMFPKFRFVRTGDFVRNGAALENFECLASACGGIGLGRFEMIGRYAEQYARDNGFKCILLDTGEVIEKGEPTAAADGRYVCEEKGDQCAEKRFKD